MDYSYFMAQLVDFLPEIDDFLFITTAALYTVPMVGPNQHVGSPKLSAACSGKS